MNAEMLVLFLWCAVLAVPLACVLALYYLSKICQWTKETRDMMKTYRTSQ